MRKTIHAAAAFAAVFAASFVLAGCPLQPTYPSTITPIYAATSANGLYVYDGASWTNYTNANTFSGLASDSLIGVAVLGSGAGATVLAGSSGGVSEFDGTNWTQTTGLGTGTISRLTASGNIYASTSGGLCILNPGGTTWTLDTAVTPVDAFSIGAYTLVAASVMV